jgi:nucleoside phosphorylase
MEPKVKQLRCADYNVAWICALPHVELLAARLMLDEEHTPPSFDNDYDDNTYIFGTIQGHRIVIATLPKGQAGNVNAGRLTGPMFKTFANIKIALLVGVGGGVPKTQPCKSPLEDVHLGDVVVGWPGDGGPAVVYWDMGRSKVDGVFEMLGTMDKPDWKLTQALGVIASNHDMHQTKFNDHLTRLQNRTNFAHPGFDRDRLFRASYYHIGDYESHCVSCDSSQIVTRIPRTEEHKDLFVFHQGRIATGNSVIQDAELRDQISEECKGVLCVEMEAAGVEINGRCLVIRGICDYADSHKNDLWKFHAAGNAAAFARELLCTVKPNTIKNLEGSVEAKSE